MSTGPMASEADVVAGCKRGARWAQRALFERHHRAIYRFLMAQCGDPQLAEDLVQDTFMRAFEAIGGFRGDARVSSWMTRIALNCLYGAGRRRETSRRKLDEVQEGDPRAAWAAATVTTTVQQQERRDLVRRALARLSDDDAAVIVLHDLQGHRYREIAAIMDVATGTVGSRLNRARARLRQIIEEISRRPEEKAPLQHPTSENDSEVAEPARDAGPRTGPRRVAWSEP